MVPEPMYSGAYVPRYICSRYRCPPFWRFSSHVSSPFCDVIERRDIKKLPPTLRNIYHVMLAVCLATCEGGRQGGREVEKCEGGRGREGRGREGGKERRRDG